MSTLAILGTLDTKAEEHAFVAAQIRERGHKTLFIDVGTGIEPQIDPDYSRYDVASAIELNLDELLRQQDRGACVVAMSEAAPVFLSDLVAKGAIDGVISLGGGGGTAIATAAMRALPIGFPKVMVSTLASGNIAHYVGTKDIVMIPSVVDVSGLNRISRMIFARATGAICGMVEATLDTDAGKPLIVASMFGNTTTCVNTAKEVLEQAGYEVLVFHATGAGGQAMESLIESGMVAGVLDVTTTEWADEVTGGVLSAGPTRMDAMSKAKVPAVIAPGCVDMANFGERNSVPDKYADRTFYIHNPQVTLMRTNADECAAIGRIIAEKANANPAPVSILLPLKAISEINVEGGPFYDPIADKALFNAIRSHTLVPIQELDEPINSHAFASNCAQTLLELIRRRL